MKVLTVWQPWASLIAVGAKPYEFRGRLPPPKYVGQRIAIHSGARKVVRSEVGGLIERLSDPEEAPLTCLKKELALPLLLKAYNHPDILVLSHILCTAILGHGRKDIDIGAEFGGRAYVNDSDREEHANFGWALSDIQDVIPPWPHKGIQGWSEWNP